MVVRLLAEISGMAWLRAEMAASRVGLGGLFFGKAVQKDDGIVDGKCQLQHHGNRIGDKRDFIKEEIRSFI